MANSSWTDELFGPKILTKPKTTGLPTASAIGPKVKLVALYFSASWCPPCKTFTPILVDFYNMNKDELEVVYISSDHDENSFNAYFGKMPWLAMVPVFEKSQTQKRLMNMFKIQGIPTLIVLDALTGNFVTANGRTEVMKATNDESRKVLFQSWLAKKAVPLDQANFAEGGDDSTLLWKVVMYIAKRPAYIIGIYYLVKKLLLYLETMRKQEIETEL